MLQVSLSGSVSSQYLTALLMAAPLATGSGALPGPGLPPDCAASAALPLLLPWLLRHCTALHAAACLRAACLGCILPLRCCTTHSNPLAKDSKNH